MASVGIKNIQPKNAFVLEILAKRTTIERSSSSPFPRSIFVHYPPSGHQSFTFLHARVDDHLKTWS